MVAVAMGLSTLVGGLYGGFEVYKDFMDNITKNVGWPKSAMIFL